MKGLGDTMRSMMLEVKLKIKNSQLRQLGRDRERGKS
jgi:hypothetical protein